MTLGYGSVRTMLRENTSRDITRWMAYFDFKRLSSGKPGAVAAQNEQTPDEAQGRTAFGKPRETGSLEELKQLTELG